MSFLKKTIFCFFIFLKKLFKYIVNPDYFH